MGRRVNFERTILEMKPCGKPANRYPWRSLFMSEATCSNRHLIQHKIFHVIKHLIYFTFTFKSNFRIKYGSHRIAYLTEWVDLSSLMRAINCDEEFYQDSCFAKRYQKESIRNMSIVGTICLLLF